MTVHDAEPGDIYVDALGRLWRCMTVCKEPTITMQEVEGYLDQPNVMAVGAGAMAVGPVMPRLPEIKHQHLSGGVNGAMWQGWRRIWRKGEEGK